MFIKEKKELLAAVSALAILMCGCGGVADVPVTNENVTRQEVGQMDAYVTIEEEEVPLAAVIPQPVPTREVEVSLQEEDVLMEVVVETEDVATPEVTENAEVKENAVQAAATDSVADEAVPAETVMGDASDTVNLAAGVQQAVNDARAAAGLQGLTVTPELSAAAAQRAAEITGSFSHTRPDGTDYHTAVTQAGGSFGSIGENLFRGMDSVETVKNAWNGSAVHLENIMNGSFTHIGIGVAETPDGVYVVQIFTD